MKLRKTDKRFNLYRYGFDCYVEFGEKEWLEYNRTVRYCRDKLGPEFWEFAGRVYGDGNWRGNAHHRGKSWSSKRVYFRGEKYYTLLLIALPTDDKNSFYL